MKKNLKYIIIALIVLLLIICIALLIISQQGDEPVENEQQTNILESEVTTKYEGYEFRPVIMDSAVMASMYLNDLKTDMLYNVEEAYNKLDEEYKQKKYPTLESFQEYIENNNENIKAIEIDKYQISENEKDAGGYKYEILDKNGNHYIFYITAVMQYKVILDTYTIDLPEFIEQYNNADDSEKVLMNIQRVFEAVNNKDYNYVYDKLDETFKQTNFPTLDSFEQYMENNYFDRNEVSYDKYQKSGNLYICEIQAKDANNENSNVVAKTFIMQLGEGTDFVMSFSV